MTAIYRSTGTLTHAIPSDGIGQAQAYLARDDMSKYLDPPLDEVVVRLEWTLHNDGFAYHVEAIAQRELTELELTHLAEEVSGQNSDGMGEGFEQQDFAWVEQGEEEVACHNCDGSGLDLEEDDCATCDGAGYFPEGDDGIMCSFDWRTNDSTFTRVV